MVIMSAESELFCSPFVHQGKKGKMLLSAYSVCYYVTLKGQASECDELVVNESLSALITPTDLLQHQGVTN